MELADLLAEFEHQIDDGLDRLSQEELVATGVALARLVARVDATNVKVLAAISRREAHRAVQHRSPGMALASELGLSRATCTRKVNRADTLVRLLRVVHTAYLAGQLNSDQVDRIVRTARNTDLLEPLVRDQAMIIGWADNEWKSFEAKLSAWEILNDPTDPQTAADKAHAKRSFVAAQGLDGVTLLQIDMPNECYAQLTAAIEPIADAMFKSDWAEARDANGQMAIPSDLTRTSSQRRFDAFMQLVRQGASAVQVDPGIQAIVHVLIDKATFDAQCAREAGEAPVEATEANVNRFRCESIDGVPLSASFAFDAAVAGHIRRVVLDLENRDITISKKARLFTGLKRHAMIIRDRWCQTPGCSTPANRGEADHIIEHSRGGPTLVTNGEMKCRPCHRHKTRLQTQGLYTAAAA